MTFWWNVFVIYSSFRLLFLITAACLSLGGALLTDMDSLSVATSLKKTTPPFCSTNSQQFLWKGRWLRILNRDCLSQWWRDVGGSSSMQNLPRYPQWLSVHKSSLYVKSRRQHLMLVLSILRFLYAFLSPISNVPWALGQGRQRCPIEDWTLSGHLFSVLWSTTSLCINGCPLQRPRLRVATIYGNKHKHLEGSLTTWSYGKTKLVGYPLGPMDSPVMGFWSCLQYYMQTVQIQPDNSCLTPTTVMPLLHLLTHS